MGGCLFLLRRLLFLRFCRSRGCGFALLSTRTGGKLLLGQLPIFVGIGLLKALASLGRVLLGFLRGDVFLFAEGAVLIGIKILEDGFGIVLVAFVCGGGE